MIRRATKEDNKVVAGLFDFIKSLEIDILKDYSEEKIFKILEYVFSSEYDRFSYKNCTVYEIEGVIKGFSFTYHYDEVEKMKDFWYGEAVSNFDLKKDSMIFDYDEVLVGELNVAQSNDRARKLYESYGFKKDCEIFIGHENYDHLIKEN